MWNIFLLLKTNREYVLCYLLFFAYYYRSGERNRRRRIKQLGSLLAFDFCEIIPQSQREIWPALLS